MSEVKYAIAILKEKLANAEWHNLKYQRLSVAEMEAIWGTLEKPDKDYAELKAQCDALAAENGALKLVLEPKQIPDEIQDLFNDTVKLDGDSDGYHEWSWVDNPDEVIIAVMNAMPKPETPATDVYLNSVRAEGVDMFISELAELFKTLKTGGKPWQALKGVAIRAASFSAKLRAGEPS